MTLDFSHRPDARSWVPQANAEGTEFPLQNLPFGRFQCPGDRGWRLCVAIGDRVLDLQATGLWSGDMAALMAQPKAQRVALRQALFRGLEAGSPLAANWSDALHPMDGVALGLPCDIGQYTDFYVGIHHATAVGRLFRPDQPLLPNYPWVPIGYHGRASTIRASGHPVRRPHGQIKAPGAEAPVLAPTQRLDFELELGLLVGPGNAMGQPVPLAQAEDHLFGMVLLNDWSARDIQAWEYQPLGPFLSKNFASTVSPWMVTWEALAPFRCAPMARAPGHPAPLPYLSSEAQSRHGALSIHLEVHLDTEAMRQQGLPPHPLSRARFDQAAYWTPAQLLTHHTVNGCQLNPGDLLGTGTLSGPETHEAGSLLELTRGGQAPVALPNGEERLFLHHGDRVELRAWARADGARPLGFGGCSAIVQN